MGFALCAHRGLSAIMPENTLPAFAAVLGVAGVDEIELDLWPSRDSVPVVCHDATVDRTTNGQGRIADMDWVDLRRLDAGVALDPCWSGVRMPRFEDVLECTGGRLVLNIHMKTAGADGAFVRQVVRELEGRDLMSSAYIAGDADVMQACLATAPDLPRCCLVGAADPEEQLRAAVEFSCARIQFGRHVTGEVLRQAAAAGIICNLFWSDDPNDARDYISQGVHVVLTNCAHSMARGLGLESRI